jgi:hypothetical protein
MELKLGHSLMLKLALDENAHIRVIRDCQNCEKSMADFI